MKTRLPTGLIATNGNGKPSFHPPIPFNWAQANTPIISFVEKGNENINEINTSLVKCQVSFQGMSSILAETETLIQKVTMSKDLTDSTKNCENVNVDSIETNINSDTDKNIMENVDPPEPCSFSSNNVSPSSSSPNVISSLQQSDTQNSGNSHFLVSHERNFSSELTDEMSNIDVEGDNSSPKNQSEIMREQIFREQMIQSDTLVSKEPIEANDKSMSRPHSKSVTPELTSCAISKSEPEETSSKFKSLDLVASTIASVAAGEGEPPEHLFKPSFIPNRAISPQQPKKNKLEKNNLSASARLPVISSLLAPTGVPNSHNSSLPGIHHIAPSSAKVGNIPSTTLPSVAHFLAPPKSPPNTFISHPSTDVYRLDTMAESTEARSDSGQTLNSASSNTPSPKPKNMRKPVTPAGLRLSLAAAEELPDPLPMPLYSDKVIRAKELGTISFDRPTVLRETVQFFLQFKHYWSSHDYDRISNLVVELFPELKDNNEAPGVPANKRIRTDLSMYARNFRRREVSQKKKDNGSMPTSELLKENKPDALPPVSSVKSFLNASSPTALAVPLSTGNPADFCNELLTAASIIESQHSASAHSQNKGNTRKHKIPEPKLEAGEIQSDNRNSQQSEMDQNAPIQFVYDKESMAASSTRDLTSAWQLYSDQVVQAMAAGSSSGVDFAISDQAIKKDLGTCARNMRRRLPAAKYKPSSAAQKGWNNSQLTGSETPENDPSGAEYMKTFMAAQNINLSELGITQRNLGELAVLAGIKQRIEQRPQDVTEIERQYLAQCSTEEQRQALISSGAFGNDSTAMAAISAFYGQLGVDITGATKRNHSDYDSPSNENGSGVSSENSEVPNKRQRRISQAEVEKRLREAELVHNSGTDASKSHEVSLSEKNLVKREPSSPHIDRNLRHQVQEVQQLNTSTSSTMHSSQIFVGNMGHEQSYWDSQSIPNVSLISTASVTYSSSNIMTQAHSQSHIQHLSGHDTADTVSGESPMNLTYSESEKHSDRQVSPSTLDQEPLTDSSGLAAQVEITTSAKKSPRRRTSSPRGNTDGNNSRDQQVWFPHGANFKKQKQDLVCLPEPLPVPTYSQKVVAARNDGQSLRHRSEIIRETARFFLNLKHWWSSADYTRISELVVQHFPDLKDDATADGISSFRRIQRDLSMCARNLRRSKKPRRERSASVPGILTSTKKPTKIKIPSSDKRARKKFKKGKTESTLSSALSDSGVMDEDMSAAAVLLQQQFMQASSPYHPSAHLLPQSQMLPSLHNHPSIHDQQMQALLQQQNTDLQHSQIQIQESNKEIVKEEPLGHTDMSEHPPISVGDLGHKSMLPAIDTSSHTDMQEKLSQRDISEHAESNQMLKTDIVAQPNTLKVYADPEHGSDIQDRFASLWKKGKFFDASLGVANRKLHVHKLVLLAMSPYLQETFKNADPRSQLEVNLPSDTTYETAKAFLKYIYEGILEVDTSSVRSLHKIATMLQMNKLAQYCQNYAQQLQEGTLQEADNNTMSKLASSLGELSADYAAQRQKVIEQQTIQRISDQGAPDLQRAAMRYQVEDNSQLKSPDYIAQESNLNVDPSNAAHFLQQDVLVQHQRALLAASNTSGLSHNHSLLLSSPQDNTTQHLIHAALARNTTTTSSSSSHSSQFQSQSHMQQQHHLQNAQPQVVGLQNDNSALLHRLASPDSTVPPTSINNSLDHQHRLTLAYWQAHTLGELMSRNSVTGLPSIDPSHLTAADLGPVPSSSEETRQILSSIQGHDGKIKSGRTHSLKETWSSQSESCGDAGHQATMLPETCIPTNIPRVHHVVNNTDS